MLRSTLAIAGLMVCTSTLNAAIVFEDDFPGDSLDTGKWTQTDDGTGLSVSGSVLSLSADTGVQSQQTFTPSDGELTVNLTAWNAVHNSGNYMGFADASSTNAINFATVNGSGIDVSMRKDGGAWQAYHIPMSSLFFQNNWTLTVSTDQVTLTHDIDGWMPPFDTDTIGPDGGGSWAIPTAEMHFFTKAALASSSMSLDAVTINQVPEPASLILAVMGAMTLGMRRGTRSRVH